MTYDLNGNTLSDGTNGYTWDARNRLVSANGGGASFAYNPLGRWMSSTLLSTTTSYLYDGVNAVQEQVGGTVTANMLTSGVDEHFLRTDSTGSFSFLTDALGSSVALTDSTGTSVQQYSYSPYGVLSATGSNTNEFTYTGRESGDGLGIDYYRARYYNPQTGRFISEDPFGFDGGSNLYRYVDDSPTNFMDPFGEWKMYGNWCGPNWTGARKEPYDPSHDLPFTIVASFNSLGYPQAGVSQTPYYAPPVDNLDAACETHDKCYYSCRANNKCNKTARKNCMNQCNQALGQGAANSGGSGLMESLIEGYMKNNGPNDDLVGPSDPSCKYDK